MPRKAFVTEAVALIGTAFLASLLFWLSLYLAGVAMVLPAAITLFIVQACMRRKMRSLRPLAEHAVFAWLVAAQASLLVAILIRVLPTLGHQLGGLV